MNGLRSKRGLSRRGVLGTLAGTVGVAWALLGKGERSAIAATASGATGDPSPVHTSDPLALGARIGPWTVRTREALHGALAISLTVTEPAPAPVSAKTDWRDSSDLHLDLLAFDPRDSRKPPAATERIAIYVRNTGNGRTQTHEPHAKMAREIARLLQGNDASLATGLLTRRDRELHHGAELFASHEPTERELARRNLQPPQSDH